MLLPIAGFIAIALPSIAGIAHLVYALPKGDRTEKNQQGDQAKTSRKSARSLPVEDPAPGGDVSVNLIGTFDSQVPAVMDPESVLTANSP